VTAVADRRRQSPTDEFFASLGRRHTQPLLKRASGTLRFDVLDGERVEHWCVAMDKGAVIVSRRKVRADTVVRLDKATSDGMVSGTVNAVAATLRGDLVPEGDLGLLFLFQRLFPPPPQGGRVRNEAQS
jgi:hypothetical protein